MTFKCSLSSWRERQRDHGAAGAAGHQAPDDRVGELRHAHHRGSRAGHGVSHVTEAGASRRQQRRGGGMRHDEVVATGDGEGGGGVEGQEANEPKEKRS